MALVTDFLAMAKTLDGIIVLSMPFKLGLASNVASPAVSGSSSLSLHMAMRESKSNRFSVVSSTVAAFWVPDIEALPSGSRNDGEAVRDLWASFVLCLLRRPLPKGNNEPRLLPDFVE